MTVSTPHAPRPTPRVPSPRRLLVIRLDRLGDVILSTPVLEVLRRHYPHAFIALMVRPAYREAVQGNPFLDEVILYDKESTHRGPWATVRFATGLRRYGFDTALVLHPSNRSHWIPWLAGIPVRIGYDRKQAWLLTHRLPHRKQEGDQHESAYAVGMLEVFGLTDTPPKPFVPVPPQAAAGVNTLLAGCSIRLGETLVAIHPSASCISKRWMPERFAQVADRLVTERGARICVIAGPSEMAHAQAVIHAMRQPAVNLAGRLSVAELAAFLTNCRLLISNDSGPVHVATGVGTPVVDIFGRNQRGLSPKRWGPVGKGHVVLHKEVGCVICLAHRCDINFLCLTSLMAEEVYEAACKILDRTP